MKKILIVYATAGEGHKRAALALKSAFDARGLTDTEVKVVDSLDYTSRFFKAAYLSNYLVLVKYLPSIWGLFYYLFDLRRMNGIVRLLRRVVNRIAARRFERFVCDYRPDIVLTTHFMANEIISRLKAAGTLNTTLITCVTDTRMHAFWYASQIDFFCVGYEATLQDLIGKWRVPAEKVRITGIPLHQKFYQAATKDEIRRRHDIRPDLFTILVTGGGFGVGPITALVRIISGMGLPLQLLVVCGHNGRLLKEINARAGRDQPLDYARDGSRGGELAEPRPAVIIKAYGFIDFVDELMTVSDAAITKAGGLICSEAIARELPLVIVAPIPGQEGRNCRFLVKEGAAVRLYRLSHIRRLIEKFYASRGDSPGGMLTAMRDNIRRIKPPDSAQEITRFALTLR